MAAQQAAFGPLRSALVLATTGANVVFWAWPVDPPRFAVPGMTDVLVRDRILGAGDRTARTASSTCTARCPACTWPGPPGAPPQSSPLPAAGGGTGPRLPWLGAAGATEAVCVAGLVMAQRQLLAAAGTRMPVRAVAAAVFAWTGLARLLPAGPAAAAASAGWAVPPPGAASSSAGVWAVLAGGVASTVAALVVLAAGATAAARWWLLLSGAATLAAVTAAPSPGRPAGDPAAPAGTSLAAVALRRQARR